MQIAEKGVHRPPNSNSWGPTTKFKFVGPKVANSANRVLIEYLKRWNPMQDSISKRGEGSEDFSFPRLSSDTSSHQVFAMNVINK